MSDPGKAVFLSYASQDAEAAKRICDALRAAGVEVWFDAEGGLEHGDEWDAKIRRQIKECVLFLPIISANTQAREEGYFRIEWELAAQRALGIASGVAFILPIVIDDTKEPDALVPDRFRTVQWTRLGGGELTPEIKARFLKLWSHRAGVVKHTAEGQGAGGREQAARGRAQGAPLPKPGWKTYAGLAGAIFALMAVVGWWMLRPSATGATVPRQAAAPPAPPPAPANPSGEETGPRPLVARAHVLYEALDSTRDDFKFAEELLTQAKAAGANDAEVWAAAAQLDERYYQRGWDVSDARREAARAATQRALRLDPSSYEARFAQAGLFAYTGSEGTEKEKLLRDLLRQSPVDHRVLRDLGSTLERQGKTDEGMGFMDQAAALPGGDPLALYNKSLGYWFAGRTAEAEAAMSAALAQKPFTGALLVSAWYAMVLHGDLAGAQAALDRIAPAELQEDRGCFFAFYLSYLKREPDAALARLQAMPRDWINDNWYRGPKGLLAGDALRLAGRPEAATAAWRAALKQVEERLVASPTNGSLLNNRTRLLAVLGERAEAGKQFAVLLQLRGLDLAENKPVPAPVTDICIELGRKKEAIRQISIGLKQQRRAVDYTAALLRLAPTYDPLRVEPEFAQVIAEAEEIERAVALAAKPARDWPKDADLKRALKLLYARDAIAEDFALAEDIVKPLLAARPNDPDVATVAAVIAQEFLTRGFDTSEARRSMVQRLTERAAQLAPDDPVALAALGRYLAFLGAQLPRAEKLLRRAIELSPDESRYYRTLLEILHGAPSAAEPLIAQMSARFPRDTLVRYDIARYYKDANNVVAMERAIDETLALEPLASAMVWKCWLMLDAHGDVPGMKASLDRVPERQRAQTRVASALATYAEVSGQAREAGKLLNDLPASWLSDFDFTGPKALLLGNVLTIDGRPDLARLQYEAALAEVKAAEERSPTDLRLRRAEMWALLGLGRRAEALATLQLLLQAAVRPFRVTMNNSWWHGSVRAALLLDQRTAALELLREAADNPTSRMILHNQFNVDPRMAPFRHDREILAALAGQEAPAAAPGTPAVAAVITDPKDPELKRALKLIDSSEAIASDVALAEDLVKGVLATRPTDPAATVAMGRVQVYYLVRGFDRSEDRFANAKRFAERGLALAPDDPDAMVVMATYLYRRGVELPRATKILRAAIALRPTEPLYYRMLDNVLSITPDVTDAEIIASAKVTAERFPADVLVQYELARHYRDAGMLEEAEHYLDIAIKLGPVANAIIARARLMLFAHGDPAGMKTLLDQLPERFRGTDRAVFSQFAYAMVTGRAELGLASLQALPEPWMIDFDYTGPTALLAGELLLQQGKAELARMRFTEALTELGRHKADFSRNFSTTWLETWLLMRLGRLDEARKRNEVYFPELSRPYRIYLGTNWWFNPINQSLLLGERAKALALMREAVGFQQGRTILRNAFRLDPRMAPFRDDPEIKALLAEPEAGK